MGRRVEDTSGEIRLDDGTWEDVGPDGRWRPSAGDRARAAVILTVFFAALFSVVLVVAVSDDDTEEVLATTTTTASTVVTTTTTTEPLDPSSLDGEPASERCQTDDRSALPLRDRQVSTVLVLNGTYRNGHAGATTAELEQLGYTSIEPDNASIRDLTSVLYKEGFCAEGERLAVDLELPDAEVAPVPEDLPVATGRARLVVILGEDSL